MIGSFAVCHSLLVQTTALNYLQQPLQNERHLTPHPPGSSAYGELTTRMSDMCVIIPPNGRDRQTRGILGQAQLSACAVYRM